MLGGEQFKEMASALHTLILGMLSFMASFHFDAKAVKGSLAAEQVLELRKPTLWADEA